MKKYRIMKITDNECTKYYPQARSLLWWYNISGPKFFYGCGYSTLEIAQEALCSYIKYPVIEYLDFDPKKDCG